MAIGRHNGGNGVRRRLRFLEEMEAVILANHRIDPALWHGWWRRGGAWAQLG